MQLSSATASYFDSDICIGRNNLYVVSWAYVDGPVYLFRSPDGGATWTEKDVFGSGVFRGEPGMCVYNDGVNDVVLLSSMGQVYKSADNGDTFEQLASLPMSSGALWWRFMEVYTNGSWFGRAADETIYMVGSQAMGVPWDGGTYVVSFSKSTDGGLTWTEPVFIADIERDTNLPEMVCDGKRLYVFYTMSYGDYRDLYVRSSDDWGETWSEEAVLMPCRGQGWVCPHSVQDLGNGRALLALGDYLSTEEYNLGGLEYGRYGYFHYSNSTFQEVGNVSGEEWQVHGGFSAAFTEDDRLLIAWAKCVEHPTNNIWFTQCDDSGIVQMCHRPWIVSTPGQRESVGGSYEYIALAREADSGGNGWEVKSNAAWLSKSSEDDTSCGLTGSPLSEGVYWVNVTVSDDNSTDSINYTIVVSFDYDDPAIPEFSGNLVLAMVVSVPIVMVIAMRRRRRQA